MPNETLALKWFYMMFHKSERDQLIASGRRLADEMIESVTEYFKPLFNIIIIKILLLLMQRYTLMTLVPSQIHGNITWH